MQNSPVDSAIFEAENSSPETPQKRVIGGNLPAKARAATKSPENRGKTRSFELRAPALELVSSGAPSAGVPSEAETRRGASIPRETLQLYLAEFLAEGEFQGLSSETLRNKSEALGKLLWFLERERIQSVRAFEVKRFLAHVKNGHLEPLGRFGSGSSRSYTPVSARTEQLYFIQTKSFFRWLTEEGLCARNPLEGVRAPKAPKPRVQPLSVEEIAALINVIRKSHHRERNEAIIYFLFDSGVRVAEMCALCVGEVDLSRGSALVTGKGNKTRQVQFGRDTARVLKRYLEKHPRPDDAALFYSERPANDGEGISTDGVRRLLKRLAGFAGLTEKRVSPHNLRHSFATEFIRAGGTPKALQMLLGHEAMDMTFRYVTLADADVANEHRKHSPARLLRGKGKK